MPHARQVLGWAGAAILIGCGSSGAPIDGAPAADAPALVADASTDGGPGSDLALAAADAGAPDGAPSDGAVDAAPSGGDAAPTSCEIQTGAPPASAAIRPAGPGLIIIYTPLGTIGADWHAPDAGFTLGPILEPLTPYRDELVIVDGIDNVVAPGMPATTAASGASVLLAGPPGLAVAGSNGTFVCGGATSFDVAMGMASAPFPSLRLGAGVTATSPLTGPLLPSYASAGRALLPELSPLAAAKALGVDPLPPDIQDFDQAVKLQIANAVWALKLGKSPTVMLSFGTIAGEQHFPWLGVTGSWGQLAAASGADQTAHVQLSKLQTWFATQVAYLLDALRATPQGGVPLLNDTVVVWVSETGEASSGNGHAIPVLLMPGADIGIKGGQVVDGRGYNQADLWYTLAQRLGATSFHYPSLTARMVPGL